jgi:hypothetical protein
MMQMELWHHNDGVATIEGLEKRLTETRIVGGDGIDMRGVEKGVVPYHVRGHVIGPFEYLGSNVDQECIRGPPSKDHDLGNRMVHEE